MRFVVCTALAAAIVVVAAGCERSAERPGSVEERAPAPASVSEALENQTPGEQPQQPTEPAERRAVVAETLAYAEVNDQLVKGHFVFPEDMVEALPAVILIHEWWGLDDNIRGVADRLASEGFIVLAVDLYNGQTATRAPDARKLMLGVVENPEFAETNIERAFAWIYETTGATEVAAVGYGYGGGWSLHAAMAIPDQLDAAVILYGQVSTSEEALSAIEVPILGLFGEADSAVPVSAVSDFEKAMQTLRKDHEVEVYPDAKGGFASPGNRNFDVELEAEAWAKMTSFLHENLVEPEAET